MDEVSDITKTAGYEVGVKLHSVETQSILHTALAKENSTRLEKPLERTQLKS